MLSWWLARHGGKRQATEVKAREDADLACVYTCTCVCICIHTYVYLVEIALDALGQGREGGGEGGGGRGGHIIGGVHKFAVIVCLQA